MGRGLLVGFELAGWVGVLITGWLTDQGVWAGEGQR